MSDDSNIGLGRKRPEPYRVRLPGGTSAAAPFVTGALALLWSEFPGAHAGRIRAAALGVSGSRRTIVSPLLDAWPAYQVMKG